MDSGFLLGRVQVAAAAGLSWSPVSLSSSGPPPPCQLHEFNGSPSSRDLQHLGVSSDTSSP